MDHADVRVIEPRNDARLALEPSAGLGVFGQLRGQDLDGHVAPQPGVPRPVDLAHPTCSHRSDDFIGAQTGPDSEWHRNTVPQDRCRWESHGGGRGGGSSGPLLAMPYDLDEGNGLLPNEEALRSSNSAGPSLGCARRSVDFNEEANRDGFVGVAAA